MTRCDSEVSIPRPRLASVDPVATPAEYAGIAMGRRTRHRFGFWAATYVLVAVMAFSTAPSPLYDIYARRDHFSAVMITIIYAAYAIGVIAALLFASHLSDVHGRRLHLAAALVVAAVAALVFLAWPTLPGLFAARVLSGVAVGLTTATATAFLRELHLAHRPSAVSQRPAVVASAALFAGFGIGALGVGLLAQFVPDRLVVPYLVLLGALVVGGAALAAAPETRPLARPLPAYRPQRIWVPADARRRFVAASATAVVAFAGPAVYSGLAGTVLATVMHEASLAMVGVTLFVMFCTAVGFVLVTGSWTGRRLLVAGGVLEVVGMAVVVSAVWLAQPSLALFLVGGGLLGAATAALFKAALGTATEVATPDRLGETLAGFYLLGYIGLSIPAIAVGVALQFASARATLAVFALCVIALLIGTLLLGHGSGARATDAG